MTCDIVYYTDNTLPDKFNTLVQKWLVHAADGKRIISVSQKPMTFGDNICLGDLGRSHLIMYRQMLAGAQAVTSPYIALAEHDCLYTPEHFNWHPPDPQVFYYNVNHWFLQYGGRRHGEYTYQRRRVLSMLIAGRDIFLKACEEKVWMIEHGWMIKKGVAGACEPGVTPPEEAMIKVPTADMMKASLPCEPGVCDNRAEYIAALNEFKDLGKEIGRWKAEAFRTHLPNLDIRHDRNFSGGRKGKEMCYELSYWGDGAELLK